MLCASQRNYLFGRLFLTLYLIPIPKIRPGGRAALTDACTRLRLGDRQIHHRGEDFMVKQRVGGALQAWWA